LATVHTNHNPITVSTPRRSSDRRRITRGAKLGRTSTKAEANANTAASSIPTDIAMSKPECSPANKIPGVPTACNQREAAGQQKCQRHQQHARVAALGGRLARQIGQHADDGPHPDEQDEVEPCDCRSWDQAANATAATPAPRAATSRLAARRRGSAPNRAAPSTRRHSQRPRPRRSRRLRGCPHAIRFGASTRHQTAPNTHHEALVKTEASVAKE